MTVASLPRQHMVAGPQVGTIAQYGASLRRRWLMLAGLSLLLLGLALEAMLVGSYGLGLPEIWQGLWSGEGRQAVVIWNLRLPRIVAAVVTGASLGLAGLATQSLLHNPLASPFTLGISQGAAFGAAFAIVILGVGAVPTGAPLDTAAEGLLRGSLYAVTGCAFVGAMTVSVVILLLARLRQMGPAAVILAGVALSSLFVSGTILIQFFADETQIASVVFWTFGDVARSTWSEIGLLALATGGTWLYFLRHGWDFNALLGGEEAARGLGVNVTRFRLLGMFLAALIAALATAFHGVIAFLGLLAPHIGRRLVGSDHRLLVPLAGLIGAILLLGADTLGRVLIGSGSLPVGVLTSFMGAPLFLYLLLRRQGR